MTLLEQETFIKTHMNHMHEGFEMIKKFVSDL